MHEISSRLVSLGSSSAAIDQRLDSKLRRLFFIQTRRATRVLAMSRDRSARRSSDRWLNDGRARQATQKCIQSLTKGRCFSNESLRLAEKLLSFDQWHSDA